MLPTLDNLRNFFLTTTAEVLGFSNSCEKRLKSLDLAPIKLTQFKRSC